MPRPHWMTRGRIYESGVPDNLEFGRFKSTRNRRLRFARKMGERKTREEEVAEFKRKHPSRMTKYQRQSGARKVL